MAEVEVDEGLAARIDAATVRTRSGALRDGANGHARRGDGQIGPDPPPHGDQAAPAGPLLKTAAAFVSGFSPPDYVVDGMLLRGNLYAMTGMTGGAKTAIALLLAEIASNRTRRRTLGPHGVEHVRVIYIACENADDVRMRMIGMQAQLSFSCEDLDLLFVDNVFDLDANLERIAKEAEAFGGAIGLVVIDTSAAMFRGDDENNNTQALKHAKSQRRLSERLPGRPCTLSLVHPIKRVDRPEQLLPRGGGAYLNEIDGNLTAWSHGDRMSQLHWTGKFRGPDFDPVEFRIVQVHTPDLVDSRGRAIPTVRAEVMTEDAIAEANAKEVFQERALIATMTKRPDGSLGDWATDCGWAGPKSPRKSQVHRVLQRLVEKKLATKSGGAYTLTASGKKALKSEGGAQQAETDENE